MRKHVVLAVAVIGVALTCPTSGEDTDTGLASRLLAGRPSDCRDIAERVLGQRGATIRQLILVLGEDGVDRSYRGPLHVSITLLGKLRAAQAVEPLSAMLTYVPEGFEADEAIPSEHYYVAAVALGDIGQPAIPAMLDTIKTAQRQQERNLAAWVIMQVEGKDQALHRFSVLARADGQASQRFRAAGDYLRTYVISYGNPLFKHDSSQGDEQ